jgi:general secretion pathway protein K
MRVRNGMLSTGRSRPAVTAPAPGRRMHPGATMAHRGFALAIVLWVLAGLTVVAVAVAASTSSSSEAVKLMRDRARAEAAFISSNARIKLLMATGLPTTTTIDSAQGRMYVDARSSRVSADEWVTLQDGRGLLNLNLGDPRRLAALLVYCGAEQAQAASLVEALQDYIDEDNLKRLNGAEAFEYRQAHAAGPRNARLLSSDEVWRVLGWAAIRDTWRARACDDLVTVHNDGDFNVGTAPVRLLTALGLSEDAALALTESRRDGLPTQAGGLFTQSFGGGGFLGLSGGVGRTVRVTHLLASVEWTMVYELEATPLRPGGPWRMHDLRHQSRRPGEPVTGTVLPPPPSDSVDQAILPNDAASASPATPQR